MFDLNSDVIAQRAKDELRRRIALGRLAAWLSLGFALPWIVFFGYFDDSQGMALAVGNIVANLFVLLLFRIRLDMPARIVWLVTTVLWALAYSIHFSGQAPIEVIFLVYLGLPFLLFSPSFERMSVIVSCCVVVVASCIAFVDYNWSLALLLELPHSGGYEDAPGVQIGVLLTVGVLLMVEMAYFALTGENAARNLTEEMQRANDALEAKSKFLANMSHEIRTPMNGIIGTIDILEHSGIRPNQRRSMSTIRESAFSLLRIIDDVLDASKMEAGKLEILPNRTELPELVEQVALTLVPLCSNHGVRQRLFINWDVPVWVVLDGVRLRQILLNILSNAIKYSSSSLTGRAGEVGVFVRVSADWQLEFEVTDNGTGMDETLVETFCEPFVQGRDASVATVRGTGLGMAITQRLLALMGGEIQVESQLDKGTTITIRLPLERADGETNLPDLNGVRVVCLGNVNDNLTQGLNGVLGRAGVRISYHYRYKDFRTLDEALPEDAIFLLLPGGEDELDHLQTMIRADYPGVRMISCSLDRSHLLHRIDDHHFSLPVHPMMRSDLVLALADLSGRALGGAGAQRLAAGVEGGGIADPAQESTAKTVSDPEDAAEPTPSAPQGPSADTRALRILIVDDNAINLHVMKAQAELLGYHAVTASGGQEGLKQWQDGEFDMIVTDCEMPDLSGFAMTRAIREQERAAGVPPIPVLAVTANIEQGDNANFARSGIDDYMLKPTALQDLKARIETMTGQGPLSVSG